MSRIKNKIKEFFITQKETEAYYILVDEDTVNLTINFEELEIFDPDLADLIITNHELIHNYMEETIKEMYPFIFSIRTKLTNFSNSISLKNISSRNIGELIRIGSKLIISDNKIISTPSLYIENISKIKPELITGIFECKGCMRTYEVEQKTLNMLKPSLCSECGGRSFRFISDLSKYTEVQYLTVASVDTKKKLKVVLTGDLCSYDDWSVGDYIVLVGVFDVVEKEFIFKAQDIEKCDIGVPSDVDELENVELLKEFYNVETDFDLSDRSSKEYNIWRDKVLKRDKICQCCGGDKYLDVHHIYSYHDYPSLRTDVENGIVLCKWCHGKFNSYYGHKGTPLNLFKFIRRFGVK